MVNERDLPNLPNTPEELAELFHRHLEPDSFIMFTGRGNIPLAKKVASLLNTPLDKPSVDNFPDGELNTQLQEVSREKEVVIFNSLWSPKIDPNVLVQETVFMSSAARLADASKVSVINPYFLGRKERKDKPRTNISAAEIAVQLVEAGGAQRLLTTDLHAEQTISAVVYKHVPWDLTYGSRVLVPEIIKYGLEDLTVVAPDIGASRRAKKHRELLNASKLAIIVKDRDLYTGATDSIAIVGDVGENAVLVDDEIATGGTIYGGAEKIKDKNHGRGIVIAAATHGKFVPDKDGKTLPQRLNEPGCPIDHVFVTDTIEQTDDVLNNDKITVVPTAGIYAIAVMCWLTKGESLGKRLSMGERLIY
jgi:ribose-phosphate pyrophosphokinase